MIHVSHSKSHSLQIRIEITVCCLLTFAQIARTVAMGLKFPKNWRGNCMLQERGSAIRICNSIQLSETR